MEETYYCFVCKTPIIKDRVEFLKSTGIPEIEFSCTKHSQTQRIKGIYSGEHGTSDIILCDKVYDDTLRSKFDSVEAEEHNDEESETG